MKYYSVAEIEMTDQGWVRTYVQNFTRLVEQRGSRYLARTSDHQTRRQTEDPSDFPNHTELTEGSPKT
jgi:uncharacterized protein (DUF1330 family)